MKHRYLFTFFTILGSVQFCAGQSELRIGEWQSFLPYSRGHTVTQDAEKVYYGTDDALFSMRKDDGEVRFFSKVDGLTDVGVHLVKFHTPENALILVYDNSNIDLIFSENIINIDDIKANTTIQGSRRVNHVFADGASKVYFSCDFGLVEFDISTLKFGFTMFTESRVFGFAKLNGAFYVTTESGFYRFNDFDNQLVANFSAWERLGPEKGLPANFAAFAVTEYQGDLYVAGGEEVYKSDSDMFLLFDVLEGHSAIFATNEGQQLIIGFDCAACIDKVFFYTAEGRTRGNGFSCVGNTSYAIEDKTGRIWYADQFPGIRIASDISGSCDPFRFNAPRTNFVAEIAIQNDVLFVATGGVNDGFGHTGMRNGFYIRQNGEWSFFNFENVQFMEDHDVRECYRILPHPDGSKVFVGTYWSGLLEYDFENFILHEKNNSALQDATGDPRERIAGMVLDAENNLWISNYLAPRPIVVFGADGNWHSFTSPGTNHLAEVAIDQRGFKWFTNTSSSVGIVVFDDGGTLDNTSDDRYKTFSTSNSALPTNIVKNIAVDHDGDVWVGTPEGPVVFDAPSDPFEGTDHGFRIRVDQDNIINYLLGDEEVTAITVDGANRKWLGTRNGIFVQSPTGDEEVAHYNVDNSPLLNNHITDIVVDDMNGDVYIGTQSGINMLRTDAIAGTPFHRSDAYAFPNPVRPDYTGPIAIRGLAQDAAVKITDVSGSLVFETRALGGQAIWNGGDLSGQQVQSGVYLVFSTTEPQFEKPNTLVTKIMVVR